MSTTQTTTWTCPHCDKEVTGYPALSRRDNKTDICSKCGEIEAFVDMSDSLPENIIHWEFRFQQICCGDDKQSVDMTYSIDFCNSAQENWKA